MPRRHKPEKAYKNMRFLNSDDARTIRILSEYQEPLSRLRNHKVNSTILFLGSSRATPRGRGKILTPYYWQAEELAFRLAKWAMTLKLRGKSFVICTGAGPGIMEAANRGAQRAGGVSIGMNISIPHEQYPNPYISRELSFMFHYFFMRKFWLINLARAAVAFPGGYGTLDELFEILTLLQAEKISKRKFRFFLYGEDYWKKVLQLDFLAKAGAISPEDLKLFTTCSSPAEAFRLLKAHLLDTF
ncbi:MAG: lysine decarboxylase [Candidatus Aminicenantes bacterium RBG_13_63_10]|nr:MAG: lysine decarboxylase [Candidatus Aminicenantes bacterium RBG_13_63_10]